MSGPSDPWTAAFLQLSVNNLDKGAARVLLHEKDVLVSVTTLKNAGLKSVPGVPEAHGGESYVRLDTLGADIQVKYDPDNLVLDLMIKPELLSTNTVDMASAPPQVEYLHDDSAFLNYAFTSEDAHNLSFLSEQGISVGRGLFDNTMAVDANGRFVRGNTSVFIDNRSSLTRWTVGDAVVDGSLLGGTAQMPCFRRLPAPRPPVNCPLGFGGVWPALREPPSVLRDCLKIPPRT